MRDKTKLKFTKDHEWIFIEDNICTIGITNFAQSELGDIVFMELPEITTSVNKSDSVATIEAVKTVADVYSPVSGEIVEINNNLENTPELINNDPYNEGWIVKLKVNLKSINDGIFLTFEEYKNFINN